MRNNNNFQFDEKTFKQLRETAIGIETETAKFALPYAILFVADLGEKNLNVSQHFFISEHRER